MDGFKFYSVEGARFVKKWYLALPVGSAIVVLACVTASLVDAARGFTDFADFGICPPAFIRHPFPAFYPLFTAPLFHQSIGSMLINLLFFPPVNAMLERQRGTLHALNYFLVVGFICTAVYVGVVMPVWAVRGGTWCIGGLGAIMYSLVTVESNEKAGVFKTRRIFGIPLIGAMYPWILLVLSWLLFPGSPFLYNLAGIFAGILYHIGALKFLFLPTRALAWIEDTRAGSACVSLFGSAYVEAPRAVALPLNDAGPGGSAGTANDSSGSGGPSLIGRIRGIFSSDRGSHSRL
ncbi:Rhomboid- protein 4 [Geranomyces variabilis]|nr:Rhomboid- protein 4 [Geranomyces variabilis]